MDMNEFNLFNNLAAYDLCVQNLGFLPVNHGQTLTDYLLWGIAY